MSQRKLGGRRTKCSVGRSGNIAIRVGLGNKLVKARGDERLFIPRPKEMLESVCLGFDWLRCF